MLPLLAHILSKIYLDFFFLFYIIFHHPSVALRKFKLQRRDIRYHEITEAILQTGMRDKRKTRKGSVTKNRIQKLQNGKHVVSLYGHINYYYVHFVLVKAIDCVKDVLKLNR